MPNEFTDPALSDDRLQEYVDEWLSGFQWGDPTVSINDLWNEASKSGAGAILEHFRTSRPFVQVELKQNSFYISVLWGPLSCEIEKKQMESLPWHEVGGGEEGDEYYHGWPEKIRWSGE